jgi:hypothetical protein
MRDIPGSATAVNLFEFIDDILIQVKSQADRRDRNDTPTVVIFDESG